MTNSRQKNSILNSSTVFVCKFIQIVLSFIVRRILITYLGEEVLGLDGLFSSILQILCLADLGINTAIVYSLYKPIAEKDERKIAALVSFFRKFYFLVGIIILLLGILLLPFLHYVINFPSNVENIPLYFLLTILGTASSYFLSSRRVAFEAYQKNRVVTMIDMIIGVALQGLQLLVIWLFSSYVIVLVLRIALSIIGNLVIYYIGNRQFPFLVKYKGEKIDSQERKELFKNTGAVLCHRVGGVFVTGTDSLIISSFISTIISGYYSNYLSIIHSISVFVTGALNALVPSIGNLKATSNDTEHHYNVLEEVVLINYCMSSFCTICLLCLINPFISLWIGSKYLFDLPIVILLCANFYISTMRFGVGAFCTAAGLFKETMIKPITESIINLIVSLILVNIYGIAGVFLGTFFSLVLGSVWVDPYFLFKKWFKRSSKSYFLSYIAMLAVACILCAVIYYLSIQFVTNTFGDFIILSIVVILAAITGIYFSLFLFPGRKSLFFRIKNILCKRRMN